MSWVEPRHHKPTVWAWSTQDMPSKRLQQSKAYCQRKQGECSFMSKKCLQWMVEGVLHLSCFNQTVMSAELKHRRHQHCLVPIACCVQQKLILPCGSCFTLSHLLCPAPCCCCRPLWRLHRLHGAGPRQLHAGGIEGGGGSMGQLLWGVHMQQPAVRCL